MFEHDERLLELALRRPEIVCRHSRRDDCVMERRYDYRNAVVPNDGQAVEKMLLRVQPPHRTRHARRRGEPVDELVQPDRAEAASRRPDEHLLAG
jgi:hypothetical protein